MLREHSPTKSYSPSHGNISTRCCPKHYCCCRNDLKNQIMNASRAAYSSNILTLISFIASVIAICRIQQQPRIPLLCRSRAFHKFSSPQPSMENLARRGHHYLFNFRQVGKVVAKKTDRPAERFVFSRFPRKKDDGSRSRERRENKERKKGTMRVSCARTSDPTFLSYLWHKIAGNCVSVCQDDFSSRLLSPILPFKLLHLS